ncbi:MAG: hypothetical protein BGO98_49740 [Myxococcales bacterium 68-20]|nr:MAG: hypothetical protein BGO98_49740 [Myxococcales bacterium 68-20]
MAALALAGGIGVVATRHAEGASDDGPALPSDAATFGFVVRGHASGVALLESTKPFSLALANGPVHGVPPTSARLATASAIVSRELARYPVAFLRGVRLAGIVLTEDLAENEMPIPSLPNVGGLLLLDVSSVESDLVRSLHHEIFHFFDLADDGRVSPDAAWEALNPPGFVYGSGGRTLRGTWAAHPSDDLPGFVSVYATSGVEEDKADTFAFALTRAPLVRARMTSNAVLRAKIEELTRRVTALDAAAAQRLGLDALLAAR